MKRYAFKLWQFGVNYIAGNVLCPNRLRHLIYKAAGIDTSTGRFGSNIWFYGFKISIGRGSFINSRVFFHNYSTISLGENVFIGPEALLTTVSHEIGDSACRAAGMTSREIMVGKGSWIGARAVILPGVTIGEGCIIASGAVVSKDCEPDGLYAGVPAKRVKNLR